MADPEDPKDDPGYCGLAPFETGSWDPFYRDGECTKHDRAFNEKKLGDSSAPSDAEVTGDFLSGVAGTFLRGAYAVTFALPYAVIGGIGGAIRYLMIGPDRDSR
jgi:hypothetical protein